MKNTAPARMDNTALVLTVEETRAALRIGRTTIYKLIDHGRLKTVKIGNATRITMESIRALVAGKTDMGAENDNPAAETTTQKAAK